MQPPILYRYFPAFPTFVHFSQGVSQVLSTFSLKAESLPQMCFRYRICNFLGVCRTLMAEHLSSQQLFLQTQIYCGALFKDSVIWLKQPFIIHECMNNVLLNDFFIASYSIIHRIIRSLLQIIMILILSNNYTVYLPPKT